MGGMMGAPVQKAKDFRGTLFRLLGYFEPEKFLLLIILLAAVLGTVFNIVGPKILGLATTKLFEGISQKYQGVPGAAVDFSYIAHVLLILTGLYVVSAIFIYLQINADCVGAFLVFPNVDEIKILALTRLLPFRIVCIRNERLAPLIFRQRFKKIDDLA
jgi:hypothetical protein